MKTVLVIGASGALGRAIVDLLVASAPNWRVVASGRYPADSTTTALDVSDREQVFSVLKRLQPDCILHLAAVLTDDFDEAVAVNVNGARNLCDAILASGYPTRLVLVGSAAEYGVVQSDANPICVNHPLQPVSVYGMSKAWQSILGLYYAGNGVDVVIARIFNLDGPNISERLFVGRVQKQIAALKAGRQQRIQVGPLNAIRDYVSLAAAAEQIIAIAKNGSRGAVYHVGSGKGISLRELLFRKLKETGLDSALVDENKSYSNHTGYDVPAIVADISTTTALLGTKQELI